MTPGWPIPATNDAAQQRLELELLLKQPVPDPEQLERALARPAGPADRG